MIYFVSNNTQSRITAQIKIITIGIISTKELLGVKNGVANKIKTVVHKSETVGM